MFDRLAVALGMIGWLAVLGCAPAADIEVEVEALRAMHEGVLQAHRDGDVDAWMALEAEEIVSANRGEISFPPAADRRTMREAYLGSTSFTAYRDLRSPVVKYCHLKVAASSVNTTCQYPAFKSTLAAASSGSISSKVGRWYRSSFKATLRGRGSMPRQTDSDCFFSTVTICDTQSVG